MDDTPRAAAGKVVAWLVFVGALALLSYGARLGGGDDTPDDAAYHYSSSVAALVQYGLMLGILLLIARGCPCARLFALRRPRSWKRALGLAALALLSIYVASFVYEQVLSLLRQLEPVRRTGARPRTGGSRAAGGAFIAFFLVVTLVAPAVEELTFRGLGVSLLEPWGSAMAILVTGILFGAAHGLIVALPILAFFGIALAWLRVRTNSVYPGMLAARDLQRGSR